MSTDPTIQDILNRLSALEAAETSEALQPTYITVDPATGLTGANFTGHIHAQGLDLSAGTTGTPPTADRVRWIRDPDGHLVAEMFADQVSPTDEAVYMALWDANSGVQVGSVGIAGVPNGGQDGPGTSMFAEVNNNAGTIGDSVNIIRQDGASDFIRTTRKQLSGAIKTLALDGGNAAINFPNNQTATPLVVNHGLGRVPQAIVISATNGPLAQLFTFSNNGGTNTNITIYAFSNIVVNGNVGLSWLALG